MSDKTITGFHQPKKGVGQLVEVDLEGIKVNGGGILNSQLKVTPKKGGEREFYVKYCKLKFNQRDRKRVKKIIMNLINGEKPNVNNPHGKDKLPKPFLCRAAS